MSERVIILKDESLMMKDRIDRMNDKMGLRGEVELQRYGKTCFKRRPNLILRRGRAFILEKIFNTVIRDLPEYNKALKEFEQKYNVQFNEQPVGRCVCLFSAGIGGCSLLWKAINKPTFDLMSLRQPIPFIITEADEELTEEEKKKYFGKKPIIDEVTQQITHYEYYYKLFTNITPHIGGTTGDTDESYVEIEIQIEDRDFRDFFAMDQDEENARINEIMLSFAIYNEAIGDYDMIEPFSMLSFNNQPLEGEETDMKFLYRVFD